MARKPQVRYFSSRSAFYTQFRGKQVCLAKGPDDAPDGETYLTALASFQTLLASGSLAEQGDDNSVKAICNAYLRAKEGKLRSSTWKVKVRMLALFVSHCGHLPVAKVKPYHVEAILESQKTWNEGTKGIFLKDTTSVFNWAIKMELVNRNPLASLDKPNIRSKSRERIITTDEHAKILSVFKHRKQQPIKRIIIALENTGARPNELTEAKVSDFNEQHAAIEYYADTIRREDEHGHKTSGKNVHRAIYFTGQALDMVKELCQQKKTNDYIFVNHSGRKYSPAMVYLICAKVGKRLGMRHFVPYAYRHTFATRWLSQGKSIEVLATLLGNSANTIRRSYSHLIHEHDSLRKHLEDFRRSNP